MHYYKVTSLIKVKGVGIPDEIYVKDQSTDTKVIGQKVENFCRTARPGIKFVKVMSVEASDPNKPGVQYLAL